MANTSLINSVRVGMNTDTHLSNIEKGQYSFALNAHVEDSSGNGFPLLQNDTSNYKAADYPEGFRVIGRKYLLEFQTTIVALYNPETDEGQWGEIRDCSFTDGTDPFDYAGCTDCDEKINKQLPALETTTQTPYCTYRTIATSTCFGFDLNYPIDIEYRKFNNSLYVYFVDGKNPLSFIYFNFDEDGNLVLQDRFKVVTGYDPENCNAPIYGDEIDCNKLRYNPNFSKPEIISIEDIPGGNIPAGVVQVLVGYSDILGNPLTSYFDESAPYPIRTRDVTIETNYETDRALSIKFENIDQTSIFEYYNIVIAQTVNNFTVFYHVATLPVTTTSFVYTGKNQIIKQLTEEEVFNRTPIFQTAGSITKASDYLFFARLKEYRKLNLQRAVNRIKVYWQTIAISEKDLIKARNVSKYRSFLRDEVYPLGLVFEMEDDNDSISFQLVAPNAAYYQDTYGIDVHEVIDNDDVITDDNCQDDINKRYQLYNTAQLIETPHDITYDCNESVPWEYGDFAYWESTETYPNIPDVWGDECGQPIRFFKFPDSKKSHHHDKLNTATSFLDNNIIYPLGIKIDHQSVLDALTWAVTNNVITQADRDRIRGYRVVRGNRFGNKSIHAKGLLYDVWNYNKYGKTYYYPNFPYNDLNPNVFIAPDSSTYDSGNDADPIYSVFEPTGRYTFHSPDTHFTNASSANFLKLEAEEYGKSDGYFNICQDQAKYRVLSTAARSLCFGAGVAAAFASITKRCRTIEKATNLASLLGLATGSAEWINIEPTLNYNSLFSPVPELLPSRVSYEDCKGTTYHWLSPIHLTAMTAEHPLEAGIMFGVLGLSSLLSFGLYFFTIVLREIDIFTNLLKSLTPKKEYFIQYNSVGKYNAYVPVDDEGNELRRIDTFKYLEPTYQNISEETTDIYFNNWNRETSLYLKITDLLPSPTKADNSRASMDMVGLTYGQLNNHFERDICSYYASLKTYIPNQYGSVYNVQFLETNSESVLLSETQVNNKTFFGGDTFISRMALKIKHPMFIQTRFQQLDEADVSYSELGNAGFPNYYLDFGEGLFQKLAEFDIGDIINNIGNFFQDLVGTDDSRMDAKTPKFFYQNGYIHLYNYGIPYFLVESDVNVDYRHAENTKEKDYYPRQKDLDYWLQEKNVPITQDNFYIYNTTYSKQNRESVIRTISPNSLFGDASELDESGMVVYTQRAKSLSENDNWRIILNNSFFKGDSVYGAITSVDGIESDKVLIRSENGSQIFGAYDVITTQNGQTQIGKGRLFDTRPQEFALTQLGYMGSQNRDIASTEFGHVFVDAKRGNVFNINNGGGGVAELAKDGMKNWFKNNLPFQIKKDFPNIPTEDLDNAFNGAGLSICFDKRFNRIFITKKDYKSINPQNTYLPATKWFANAENKIKLTDPVFFEDRSWTVSYNFVTKTWTSFHSFQPNYYIEAIDHFKSGINTEDVSSLWSHGISNKSYQVYYGKLEPFIIDIPSTFATVNNTLNSIEYVCEVIRYHNDYDFYHNPKITFNKGMVYTNSQNSGLLNFNVKDENDLSGNFPKLAKEGFDIKVTNSEDTWRFNQFFDVASSKYNNMPLWVQDGNHVNKQLNKKALDYYKPDSKTPMIRGKVCNVRLINDKYSLYKFIFILNQFNQVASIR